MHCRNYKTIEKLWLHLALDFKRFKNESAEGLNPPLVSFCFLLCPVKFFSVFFLFPLKQLAHVKKEYIIRQ